MSDLIATALCDDSRDPEDDGHDRPIDWWLDHDDGERYTDLYDDSQERNGYWLEDTGNRFVTYDPADDPDPYETWCYAQIDRFSDLTDALYPTVEESPMFWRQPDGSFGSHHPNPRFNDSLPF